MSSSDEFDLGSKGGAIAPPDALSQIKEVADEWLAISSAMIDLENKMAALRATEIALRTRAIPDLLMTHGVSSVEVGGYSFKLDSFVSGGIPKDPEKRAKAFSWLIENGQEGLIKVEVSVEFGKDMFSEAQVVADLIKASGHAPTLEKNVHPQTLLAFVRQRMKNGEDIDLDVLGIHTGNIARIEQVKKGKKS